MERDKQVEAVMAIVISVSDVRVEQGVSPVGPANEIAMGLSQFLCRHLTRDQAAAFLGEYAALTRPPAPAAATASDDEMTELSDKALQFLRTLELAGVDESTAVTVLHNACVLRVARSSGAAAAADWLRRTATIIEGSAADVDRVAGHFAN